MERLRNKLSKLGNDSKNTAQDESKEERGKLDESLARNCYKKNIFQDLEGREQEAFFRFLRGGKYPEKEDICSDKITNVTGPSRKYQFWVKCKKIELLKLFEDYISTDDDDKRLPEVQDCMSNESDVLGAIEKKRKDAEGLDIFIKDLRNKVEHELQQHFTKFKEDIEKEFKIKA